LLGPEDGFSSLLNRPIPSLSVMAGPDFTFFLPLRFVRSFPGSNGGARFFQTRLNVRSVQVPFKLPAMAQSLRRILEDGFFSTFFFSEGRLAESPSSARMGAKTLLPPLAGWHSPLLCAARNSCYRRMAVQSMFCSPSVVPPGIDFPWNQFLVALTPSRWEIHWAFQVTFWFKDRCRFFVAM